MKLKWEKNGKIILYWENNIYTNMKKLILLLLFIPLVFSCSSEESESQKDILEYLRTVEGYWLMKQSKSTQINDDIVNYEKREYIKFNINSFLYETLAETNIWNGTQGFCKRYNIGQYAQKGDIISQSENSFTWEAPFNQLGGGFSSDTFTLIITLSVYRNSVSVKRAGSQYPADEFNLVSYEEYNDYLDTVKDCN